MSSFISTVTAPQLFFEPPHTRGDKEFDGNGPRVNVTTELQTTSAGVVSAVIKAKFEETKSDWTTFSGSSSPITLFSATGGFTITTPTFASFSFTDTNHANDIFFTSGLVRRYEIVGDRDGGLFGGDDKPSVRVDLNPIQFILNDAANNVSGGAFNDTLSGNDGNDILNGGAGNDRLFGDGGNDLLLGSSGSDILEGLVGNDSLFGGQGGDSLFGGVGDDFLHGGDFALLFPDTDTSNDILDGGSGNDQLNGGSGNDQLNGGFGNDSIIGGLGNDTLIGGENADQFRFSSGRSFTRSAFGVDTITDFQWPQGDKIVLSKTTFTALRSIAGNGFSVSSEFARVTTDAAAAISSAFIVYNTSNGKLFYNSNGSASNFASTLDGGGHFATFAGNPFLIGGDFIIQ